MHAGLVACCPLLSHGDYVDGTDRQTDGHQTVTFRCPHNQAETVELWQCRLGDRKQICQLNNSDGSGGSSSSDSSWFQYLHVGLNACRCHECGTYTPGHFPSRTFTPLAQNINLTLTLTLTLILTLLTLTLLTYPNPNLTNFTPDSNPNRTG